ncbi:hypothetical protein RPB_0806 [Rhodopseudomonas palustris HaA2]|uniref:Uncharacterized protein n=1 Tax=Rhodopseudomonas palustris (strain HaA2) TaxID=316058 RepID=Q2J1Z3_RHOP2|nr:hypothetical protein [Rhodopseudomonas palustris]ABD05517.1 hypothetical protein RPB_0806 [Rhodopseudomonas palustris HaA2]
MQIGPAQALIEIKFSLPVATHDRHQAIRSFELFRTRTVGIYRLSGVNQCKESVAVAASGNAHAARRAAMSRVHTGGRLMAGRTNERETDRMDQIDRTGVADTRSDRATRVWARNRLRELAESGQLGLSSGTAPRRVSASVSATR